MEAPELLCDLRMIKAGYQSVHHKDRDPDHCFRIRIIPDKLEIQFDISEANGELFAAELAALAAIIRARVVQARVANA